MARKNSIIQEVDTFIGDKVYKARLARGMTRQQLAQTIGVTHQQLQKYEKGLNRISVGRLVLIAEALKENISYFYEGVGITNNEPMITQHQRMCIEISRNFMKIVSSKHQDAVNSLVRSLAKESA